MNDEMIKVKRANTTRKKMNAKQLKEYLEGVTRFQEGERWGLRVKDDIIAKPIYSHISSFEGDYAVCAIGRQRFLYGILDRRGNIILPMEYESVYLIGGHRASVTKVHGFPKDIEL